jgi:hypothetical protein
VFVITKTMLTLFVTSRYNSAISSSLASYGYAAAVVNEKFLHGNSSTDIMDSQFDGSQWPQVQHWDPLTSLFDMQRVALDGHTLVNRSQIDCLNVYTDMYGARTNLLMVTQDASSTEAPTLLQYTYVGATLDEGAVYWPCSDGAPGGYSSNAAGGPDCGKVSSVTTENLEHWTKFGRPVLYCLSEEPLGDRCRLNYSPTIMNSKNLTLTRCLRELTWFVQ